MILELSYLFTESSVNNISHIHHNAQHSHIIITLHVGAAFVASGISQHQKLVPEKQNIKIDKDTCNTVLPTVLSIHSLTAIIEENTRGLFLDLVSSLYVRRPCSCQEPDSDRHSSGEPATGLKRLRDALQG